MGITCRGTSIILGLILTLIVGSAFAQAGPAANSRYVIKGDTVYDKETNLSWQRCSVGQRWVDGTGCVGMVKTFDFHAAQQQGSGTWRVPTKDELPTLVDLNRKAQEKKPMIDEVAFPDTDPKKLWYWTSTPAGESGGWYVCFGDGDLFNGYYEKRPFAVRLVRRGQ
jgi:hypothetical protein